MEARCAVFGERSRYVMLNQILQSAPCTTIDKPVVIEDLHATLYHAMGVSPQFAYEVEWRPFYVTRDGVGKPITEILDS